MSSKHHRRFSLWLYRDTNRILAIGSDRMMVMAAVKATHVEDRWQVSRGAGWLATYGAVDV